MSRPQKEGLEYFPLDVTMDDNIDLLEFDHGLEGFAILIKLYQKIYDNGYYLKVDKRILKLFSKRINVDINLVESVIMSAITYKIFSKTLFERYQVLTSKGIQKRYFKATERRSSVEYFKEIFLLNPENYKNLVEREFMYTETPTERESLYTETPTEQEFMYAESTQSKVKNSKVKESKEYKINNRPNLEKIGKEFFPDTEPEETPTAVASPQSSEIVPQVKKLSPLKDDLAQYWQEQLTRLQPSETWGDFGKERQQLNTLARKTKNLLKTVPFENAIELVDALLMAFTELKKSGKDKRIRSSPVIPSRVSQFWPEVTTYLAEKWEKKNNKHEYHVVKGAIF